MADAEDAQPGIGLIGLLLVLAGAALVLVSFRFLDWYALPHRADSAPEVTFSSLHHSVDQFGGAVVATAYFDWLAWVLVIAVIATGAFANAPARFTDALRVAGFIVGLLGSAATFYALAQYFDATGSAHSVLYNSTWGLWIALVGYLLAGVGAAMGPRTRFASRPRAGVGT